MTGAGLDAFLSRYAGLDPQSGAIAETVRQLTGASRQVWALAQAGVDFLGAVETGVNPDGDKQVKLDVVADDIFLEAARRSPVAFYASEERQDPVEIDPARPLALAVDPLDGSSNVDLNLSFGTIFSILPAGTAGPMPAFLQPGHRQLAAGLIVYGPQLSLVLSLGVGTHFFSFSGAAGEFLMVREAAQIPAEAREFAINASNYRHWDESVRLYYDDCVRGVHGPRAQDFNMRWLASMVVEAYRILNRGGVFLYPADKRPGYGRGRLRLIYEANPVAMLMEQAGGLATDGVQPILSLTAESLHQRTPLIFGSGREVAKLTRYHTEPSAIEERAPLFGNRGLFRH